MSSSPAARGPCDHREWMATSAEAAARARDALTRAAAVLGEGIPGRPPDSEAARAWAEIGNGWATLAAGRGHLGHRAVAKEFHEATGQDVPAWMTEPPVSPE